MDGIWILRCLGRDRCNDNFVCNQETAVESETERADEVALACTVLAICFGEELGRPGFR